MWTGVLDLKGTLSLALSQRERGQKGKGLTYEMILALTPEFASAFPIKSKFPPPLGEG